MVDRNEGVTKIYNRFHDIYETTPRISELRELHNAMDRAVLDAYGWTDIPTDCEFLLDYEIDEATWGRKKKPYRYRWPDTVRDEVLARPPRPQRRTRSRRGSCRFPGSGDGTPSAMARSERFVPIG